MEAKIVVDLIIGSLQTQVNLTTSIITPIRKVNSLLLSIRYLVCRFTLTNNKILVALIKLLTSLIQEISRKRTLVFREI